MKKIILMSATLLSVMSVQAQDFKPVLQKTFEAFNATDNLQQKVEQSNKLSLIAKKYDKEWITHYYAALSKTILSFNEKDAAKRDAYLDEADKEYEDATSILGKPNSETYVLAAMIANGRLAVDPMNRWQKYGKIFDGNLSKAKELNADNPRIYFLEGNSKFHTPKAFGGGKKAALPYYQKADALFAKETTGDIAIPHWGKKTNTKMLEQSKGDD